jgi:hypothetical protein
MKVYLCSQFARQTEMQFYRNDLHSIGWSVTSHWIDEDPDSEEKDYAIRDLEDIDNADALIYFPGPPYHGDIGIVARGGRHFEQGVAYEAGKVIIVIGEPESDFQKLPTISRFRNWAEFMSYMTIPEYQ